MKIKNHRNIITTVLAHYLVFVVSGQFHIPPDDLMQNPNVQIGTFDIGTDTSTVFAAAGFGTATKTYTLNLVVPHPSGYAQGLSWRNLEWDFTTSALGYIRINLLTVTSTNFSFKVDSFFAFFILRLKFCYIVIDPSVHQFLYIQSGSINLSTNPSVPANSFINSTLLTTFPGSSNHNSTITLIYAINYELQVIAPQNAGLYLSITGLNTTHYSISLYVPYFYTSLSTVKFFILYFIPTELDTLFSQTNYQIIATGQPIGAVLTKTNFNIYTSTNKCQISDSNTFIGLESFSKSDRVKFQLFPSQTTVNITAFYYGFRFSFFSICYLSCLNSSFPYFFTQDAQCYDNCPVGYYGNLTQNLCNKCEKNCQTCEYTALTCLTCKAGTFLYKNDCSSTCPKLDLVYGILVGNNITKTCEILVIDGCVSAILINSTAVCLQCNMSQNLEYDPKLHKCVCKVGYTLQNGQCAQFCGDGIIITQPCDDGNRNNGDGCNYFCQIQKDFTCNTVPNGPTLTSKCVYLPKINFQILSQTKLSGENTLKIILKISPTPKYLTSNDIKNFINLQIANKTIDLNSIQITYKDGIAQIYIPYSQDIENAELHLWTNFNPIKFASQNSQIYSILSGDNVALQYSSNWMFYHNLSIFNFSLSIIACVVALLSFYKHKMIGLELIVPIQMIFYSQQFYKVKATSNQLYNALKPVSFSFLSPNEMNSKSNSSYNIQMTGGFLQNYNLLGFLFLISSILLVIFIIKMHFNQKERVQMKITLNDWLKIPQNKSLFLNYQVIIWKAFFAFFSLSTIPLLYAILAKAKTQIIKNQQIGNFQILSQKGSFIFVILFSFGLFYTSIPKIFYNNSKCIQQKFVFRQQCNKFKYEAIYCTYFQIHYLIIGLIVLFCEPTKVTLYALSAINGGYLTYLLISRPYISLIDNIGSILSCLIVTIYLSINLAVSILQFILSIYFYNIFAFLTIGLIFINFLLTLVRLYLFWKYEDCLPSKKASQNRQKKNPYIKQKVLKQYIEESEKCKDTDREEQEIKRLMKQSQPKKSITLSQSIDGHILKSSSIKRQGFLPINNPNNQKNESQNDTQQCKYSSLQKVKHRLRESFINSNSK